MQVGRPRGNGWAATIGSLYRTGKGVKRVYDGVQKVRKTLKKRKVDRQVKRAKKSVISQIRGKAHSNAIGGGSYSYHRVGKRAVITPAQKKLYAIQTYRQIETQRVSTSVGRQAQSVQLVGSALVTNLPTDWNFMFANRYTLANATTTTPVGVSTTSTYTSLRCHLETRILNTSNVDVEITIYDYAFKKNESVTGTNFTTNWSTTAEETSLGNPHLSTNPGATPFEFTLVTRKFAITKKYKIMLSSGATHVHTLNQHCKKTRKLADNTDYPYSHAGYTMGTCVNVLGAMANDTTTKTQISYAACAVDIIQTLTMVGYSNPDTTQANQWVAANQLPQAFTINPSVMEEATNQTSVVENA